MAGPASTRSILGPLLLAAFTLGCHLGPHIGTQGYAARKTDWKTGGTVLYGTRSCDPRIDTPCHKVWTSLEVVNAAEERAKNEAARSAAWAEAEAELSKTLARQCAQGWSVEERGVPGWVKAAPTIPQADGEVVVYRCH